MIKILLVDDHHLVREGIKAILEKQGDIEIVGEAENGQEAIDLATQLAPDVIVMDISMPLMNGIEATAEIKSLGLKTRVIILSMYSDDALVRRALIAGAQGYVLKRSITAELILAIRYALRGEMFLSPGVSKVLIEKLTEHEPLLPGVDPIQQVSPGERTVLQLVAEGYPTKKIAEELGEDEEMVECHRASLMKKLGVNDVGGLVVQAIKLGLLRIDG